jgi:hypothetical protein
MSAEPLYVAKSNWLICWTLQYIMIRANNHLRYMSKKRFRHEKHLALTTLTCAMVLEVIETWNNKLSTFYSAHCTMHTNKVCHQTTLISHLYSSMAVRELASITPPPCGKRDDKKTATAECLPKQATIAFPVAIQFLFLSATFSCCST